MGNPTKGRISHGAASQDAMTSGRGGPMQEAARKAATVVGEPQQGFYDATKNPLDLVLIIEYNLI